MEQNHHYYAFISYSTADSKWAKWLQNELSYYHIPSSVKKSRIGIPDKIRPVFIYEYDLAGNRLHTAIQQELESSKYLIVICSPNAAKSKYVNGEIETFIRMGRGEYIIPFIVDGEVNSSDSSQECFPPALLNMLRNGNKNDELRGINIMTNGKRQALVDVVATMLGVRRDVLWNRYKMRRLKQRIFMAAVAALVLLFGLVYWDYTRPTYRYYTDYVDVWGVPSGVLELDKEHVRHRGGTYRFEYRRIPLGQPDAYHWRLAEVVHINSEGTPTPIGETVYIDRHPIQILTYSPDNGRLTDITYCNEKAKSQIIHKLSRNSDTPAAIVDIESVVAGDGAAFAKSMTVLDSDDVDKSSNITRYVYERNSDGYIVKVTFHANNSHNFNSSAVADNFGVWGMTYELDSLGRREAIHYLDKDGSYHCNKIGVSTRRYKYDQMGNICSEHILDLRGRPTLNERKWAISFATFDNYGNTIEQSYYNTIGEPCLHKNMYAKVTARYDDRGNAIECAYYGVDGEPCLNSEGYATWISKYDDRGNETETACYGVDGKPCMNYAGYAIRTLKYDDRGNILESSYYGVDGEPCLNNEGYATWISKYDDRGNAIECACYGVDGEPCLNRGGVAKWTRKYDDRGNEIETAYYGIDGEPCLNYEGHAKFTSKYDNLGNLIETSSYGIDGKPCLNTYGYATWISKYDDRGNILETSYYGVDGEPCLNSEGVAKWTRKYDDRGNEIETACYGVDGKPCLSIDGSSIMTMNYNDRCQITELSYYDTERKPINVRGYFKDVRKYDERNNFKEAVYYDKEGKQLAELVFTMQVTGVTGAALAQGLPVGSIELQFNEWWIGDAKASYMQIAERCRYAEKNVYYLTPTGEFFHLYVKGGLMGTTRYDFMVEKGQVQKWLQQLDEWKKSRHN